MKLEFSEKKLDFVLMLAIFFIACLIVFSNLGIKYSFVGDDPGVSMQFLEGVNRYDCYLWNEYVGAGAPLPSGVQSLAWNTLLRVIGLFVAQKFIIRIMSILFFSLCGMSMYYLVHMISKTEGMMRKDTRFLKLGAFIGALVYMMNHLIMILLNFPLSKLQFPYCIYPFIIALFIYALHKPMPFYKIFISAMLLLILFCGNPANMVVIFNILLLYFIYFIFIKTGAKEQLFRKLAVFLCVTVLFLLFTAFIWLPTLLLPLYGEALAKVDNANFLNDVSFNSHRSSFLSLWRLDGYMCFLNFPFAGQYYSNAFLVFLGFAVYTLLPFSVLLFFRKSRFINYFVFVYLMFLFFAKGTYPPGRVVFEWVFIHVPYFAMFKSQYIKLIVVPVILGAVFSGFSSAKILSESPKSYLRFFIGLVAMIIGYNHIFVDGSWNYKSFLTEIPADYQQTADFINSLGGNKRILMCPETSGFQISGWKKEDETWARHHLNDYQQMYVGGLIHPYVFNKPCLNMWYFKKYFSSEENAEFPYLFPSIFLRLKYYDVGYICLEKSFLDEYNGGFGCGNMILNGYKKYQDYKEILKKTNGLALVLDTPNWSVYKISDDMTCAKIYSSYEDELYNTK
ncbi:MAG: hypothetical protein HY810_02405 [Candidatus Omnitrophica bacterium]|nr:hypothetical protein [Candidatus Omnitrophota bacterium]